MAHTTKVLTALSHQPDTPAAAQEHDFQAAMDDLLATLHSVDVHMKRQIWALEEAGIIRLAAPGDGAKLPAAAVDADAKLRPRPTLEPNGVGSIGNLDVGWLNSRNDKVERDMAAELWGRARRLLDQVAVAEEAKRAEDARMTED